MKAPDFKQEDQAPASSRPVIELQIREASTVVGVRMVECTAVPIGLAYRIDGQDLVESFAPGCFAQAVQHPEEVCFADGHGRDRATRAVVGRGVRISEESPAGAAFGHLRCVFRLGRTAAADEVYSAIEDGLLEDVSIGFRELSGQWVWSGSDKVRRYDQVRLWHVAAVDHGAYHPHSRIVKAWQEGRGVPTATSAPTAPPRPATVREVQELADSMRGAASHSSQRPPRLGLDAARRLRVELHQDATLGTVGVPDGELERLESLIRRHGSRRVA
jgi:HK97 family phage prohead protease